MYYAYLITNNVNFKVYVGITTNLKERWSRHKSIARNLSASTSPLYNAMRKYGVDNFSFQELAKFTSKADCERFEIDTIARFRNEGITNYNLHDGGTFGFAMTPDSPKWETWKENLRLAKVHFKDNPEAFAAWKARLIAARKGRTPALGMKHTDENKQLASKVSNEYWDSQNPYTRDLEKVAAILALSHKEAKQQFGISTTHYYRLKKRFTTNDSK